ncbi:glutaminase A [Crystallibacter degradans]|uniref:glutaminase A n=1 Tax=Crystallibacter degradans TaxID=2726743 RepID=UPI001472BCD7|nr:glutaminase A [Arthrobacter sp. SF27]NMR28736.1 glutaminase A [Arthrobacter sp. SF27]
MESPIESYLRSLHTEISQLRHGLPYSVGPASATIDPDNFGICLATVDGYVYEVGDSRKEFTMQSISKPFTYALALSDLGMAAVDEKVDVEPSGDPFNEISLAAGTGRPANAMINAGALAVTSLVKGSGGRSAIKRIVSAYSDFAGRDLAVSEKIFEAEFRNSDRNHALAYLLSSFNIIEDNPTAVLENYLRQCSVQVTCRDLSIMAATLANSGTNPVTGVSVMDIGPVERVLSVMMTSGMYDDAGDWVSHVGMPAKSGVGGGTIAVLPGQAGLAVFSPPLDEHGGSVRGIATSQRLSDEMEMHFVRSARAGRSAIRASYDIAASPSGIRRDDEAALTLREHGHRARVIELNGDLLFAGTESTVRAIAGLDSAVELVILDLRRVGEAGGVAHRLLPRLQRNLAAAGKELVLVDREESLKDLFAAPDAKVRSFDTRNAAVEYAENRLISLHNPGWSPPARVPVAESPAMSTLSPDDIAALESRMETRTYHDGGIVRRVGQRFGGVFFIISGKVNTIATGPDGARVRLSTLSAGMTFGELALGSEDRQETTEKAEGPVEVKILTAEAIDELQEEDPRLAVELWRALTRDAYTRVDQYLRESAVRVRDT